MKKIIIWSFVVLIVVAIIYILFANQKRAEQKVYRYDPNRKVLVTAAKATITNFEADKVYSGSFEPYKESKLMFELPGKINNINFDIGERVGNGSIIASLDIELLKLQKEQAEVQVNSLEKDYLRYKTLLQDKAVQLVQYEKIETAYNTAIIQLKTINQQLYKSSLRAPFSGIITMKYADIGTIAAPQLPIVQLSDISKLKLTISVPETEIQFFKINDKVQVKKDINSQSIYQGNIIIIGGKSDITHNFIVQIEVDNYNNEIRAGTFGYVIKKILAKENQIVLPLQSLVGSSIKPQIYVVENNKAIIRDIEIFQKNDNYVAIRSGVKEGETVITSGFINLSNGQNVTIKQNNIGD